MVENVVAMPRAHGYALNKRIVYVENYFLKKSSKLTEHLYNNN